MSYIGKQPAKAPLTSSDVADDIITLAKMAGGTDGNIITYDASGNPAVVATGTSGHFLKSQGAGNVPVFAAAGGGKIGQVAYTQNTAVESTTATSFATISDFSVDITPAATSSKILISAVLPISSSNHNHTTYQLFRDATQIGMGDAAGSRTRASFGWRNDSTIGDYSVIPFGIQWIDSPSSTSQITYSFKWNTDGGTIYMNRSHDNTDNANYHRTASQIMALEILA